MALIISYQIALYSAQKHYEMRFRYYMCCVCVLIYGFSKRKNSRAFCITEMKRNLFQSVFRDPGNVFKLGRWGSRHTDVMNFANFEGVFLHLLI